MQPAHTPFKIPETMTLESIGPYLAALREKFNLSLQDVAERLHIRLRYLNALETNQMDDLPGAAYARGYLHSYATFLGLDANQVVALCFPPKAALDTPTPAQAAPAMTTTAMASALPKNLAAQWRGLAIAAVVAIIVAMVISQVMGAKSSDTPVQASVAPVPEDMLASVRTGLMPTPKNYRCFAGEYWLSCLFADAAMQQILSADIFTFRELNEDDMAELESLEPAADEKVDE